MPDWNRREEGPVIALAGRRVDEAGTHVARFPLANVPLVRQRLAALLVAEGAAALVSSAACGADLVALQEAERLGLSRRIVLPFAPEHFRETSVTDRPGGWGRIFDRLIAAARLTGDLVVVGSDDDDAAYAAANEAIIAEAHSLNNERRPEAERRLLAVIVWEGAARSGNDATEGFRSLAAQRGFELRTVLTQ
jgi:hypothetical protein